MNLNFRLSGDIVISEIPFVVIDAETTGLKKSDRLVSLGGLHLQHYSIDLSAILDQKYAFWRNSSAVEIHGELSRTDKNDIEKSYADLLQFLSNRVIVGHNIAFDIAKINQTIGEKYPGFKVKNKVLDTFGLMMRLNREKYERQVGGNHNLQLEVVCKEFGISVENRHTALGDAFMTAQVFLFLLARLEQRGVLKARQLLN